MVDLKKLRSARFSLGRLVATPGALEALKRTQTVTGHILYRHSTGDWGDVCEADKRENELSLKEGFRILSAYTLRDGTKIWVITEADRSSTCILLPSEY